MLKKYLLSSVAFRPDDELGADTPEDERIEIDETDDELVTDPEGEPEGDGADDGDDDTEAAEADAEPAVAAREPSRRERRITALSDRTRTLAEQNAALTRQIDELRRNPPQAQQPQETPEQEQAKLALMSPEERQDYKLDKALGRHERNNQALAFQLMDQSDRVAFEGHAAVNPLARKLGPEVERRLAALRQSGGNATRDVVFTYLLGEKARAQLAKKNPKAGERVRQQRTEPVRARGDVTPDRRRQDGSVAAMERRLENQQI